MVARIGHILRSGEDTGKLEVTHSGLRQAGFRDWGYMTVDADADVDPEPDHCQSYCVGDGIVLYVSELYVLCKYVCEYTLHQQ